ncbi:hypothetical protein WJX81_004561 [Elliptochloris bilobata]|uniref:SAP domain-containing protein n=1 Tax=Elliptochloris bilobata TaxID=381761 RepID=A0AAW1QWL3_9CHLO
MGPCHRMRVATACCTTPGRSSFLQSASKTALRKLSKAKLVAQMHTLSLDTMGTKDVLIDRVLMLRSQSQERIAKVDEAVHDKAAEPLAAAAPLAVGQVAAAAAGELVALRAECAHMDEQLALVSAQLTAVNTEKEAEQANLQALAGQMAALREAWQADAAAMAEMGERAAGLEASEEALAELRAEHARFQERVAMLQRLLTDRDGEIARLRKQLEEYKVAPPVLVPAGAGPVGEDGAVALLERPGSGGGWASSPSPARELHSHPILVAAATGAGVTGAPAARFSANGVAPARFADVTKRHGAPGLAVLAGAQGLVQAWTNLKRGLPQETRLPLDLAAAMLAAAAHVEKVFSANRTLPAARCSLLNETWRAPCALPSCAFYAWCFLPCPHWCTPPAGARAATCSNGGAGTSLDTLTTATTAIAVTRTVGAGVNATGVETGGAASGAAMATKVVVAVATETGDGAVVMDTGAEAVVAKAAVVVVDAATSMAVAMRAER